MNKINRLSFSFMSGIYSLSEGPPIANSGHVEQHFGPPPPAKEDQLKMFTLNRMADSGPELLGLARKGYFVHSTNNDITEKN
jgi:hypothetical protein